MTKKTEAERRQAALARKASVAPKKLPVDSDGMFTIDRRHPEVALMQLNKTLASHRESVRKLERVQASSWRHLVAQGYMTWAQISALQGVTRQALQKQVRKYFPED